MSRVTLKEQYRRHEFLRMLWHEPNLQIFFTLLSVMGQWETHSYYASNEEFTELEFKDHLDQVNKQFPHLCHIAGKHFKYLEEVFTSASNKYGVDNDQMHKVIFDYAIRVHNPPQESKPVDESKSKRKAGRASSNVSIIPLVRPNVDVNKLANIFLKLADELIKQKAQKTEERK